MKPKEEKRSNKTRPIFGKEVTGKEKGLQRAALGKDGGTAKIEVYRGVRRNEEMHRRGSVKGDVRGNEGGEGEMCYNT